MITVAETKLPRDIMTDRVTGLPLKSLIRFRFGQSNGLTITDSSFSSISNSNCYHLDRDCKHNHSSVILTILQGPQLYSVGGGCQEDSFQVAVDV
jgi:hypothetical protein